MIDEREIHSLVKLLDDPDAEISYLIEKKLMSYGGQVVPFLETEWETCFDALLQQKLESLISRIQFDIVKIGLTAWYANDGEDLLEGVFLIAKFKYPELEKQTLSNQINKIKLDAWLELNYDLSSFEKTKILNHVIYDLYGFQSNTQSYHSPNNSFINQVLESRRGNPVSLSVVYQLVAHSLNIPIYGVNLPQHFVLAYRDDSGLETIHSIHDTVDLDNLNKGQILFYINSFNHGAILSLSNLEQFVKQLNLELDPNYFVPCSNIEIVKRMLRNLLFSYAQNKDKDNEQDVKQMLNILGEPDISAFGRNKEDNENDNNEDEEEE